MRFPLLSTLSLCCVSAASAAVMMKHHPEQVHFQPTPTNPTLADILTTLPRASIFYEYLRDFPVLSGRINLPSTQTTLFVPTNNAIMMLARKPHRQGFSVTNTPSSSRDEEDESKILLERWLHRHIVPGSIELEAGNREYETMLEGRTVTVRGLSKEVDGEVRSREQFEGKVMPGDVTITDIIETSNGRIILLDETLSMDA